jgi:hypothetical protein
MSVVLLDDMVLEWSRQGLPAVNEVLTHYSGRWLEKPRLRHGLKRIPNEHGNRALCAAE